MSHVKFYEILKDYLDFHNISNKEFAARIGVTPKHLIDILSGKAELSFPIIHAISIVTDIPSDYIIQIEENSRMEDSIKKFLKEKNITLTTYLNKFLYKYLISEKWLIFNYADDKMSVMMDILKYLRASSPYTLYNIDKNILYKSNNDKPELLMLWLEKCYRQASKQVIQKYNKDNINILVNLIRDEAVNNNFNEEFLIKQFNMNGIQLVIEDDLPGSKVRGAFKVNKDTPAIYLTRKHKRIADIYFALLHELAHCKKDFNKAKATNLVSYDDKNDLEIEADEQAYAWMIDKDYYKNNILSSSYDLVSENKFPKSFIVYILAKNKMIEYSSDIYQKFNPIIFNKQKKGE